VALARPIATASINVSTDSVNPTVATAPIPSRATKKISQMAKTDSITISRIIGTASNRIARRSGPAV
jgi:hypothetical protein